MKLTLALSTLTSCVLSTHALRNSDNDTDNHRRSLATVTGACTVNNFSAAVGGNARLSELLGVPADGLQAALTTKCEEASAATTDFVDSIGKGPQFMKNFFDGGSEWNDYKQDGDKHVLSADAKIIETNYGMAKTSAFSAPNGGANDKYEGYFSNFLHYGEECRLGIIECCYKSTRLTDTLIDNAEMCAMDLTPAKMSNHIRDKSWTLYSATDEDKTYCTGFAWDPNSFEEKVKFNTLYHVAFKEMLMGKGYVKNIPGAPMCGCIEQMPIITNAACTKVIEGYNIDDTTGAITMNLSWKDCEQNLLDYYKTLTSRSATEDNMVAEKIVGDGKCYDAVTAFMNDKMYVRMEE